MKVIRDLEISATEFFDGLFEKVVEDINKNTDKEITKKDLKKGFKVVHRGDSVSTRMTFEVVDFEKDKMYKAKRSSVNGTTSVYYLVKANDKGGITVTFEQIFPEETKQQGKMMKGFSEALFLGRMTDSLYDIQKKVLNEKEGITEVKVPFQSSFWSDLFSKKKK